MADYVEPGVSATDDKRPEFQRMIDAATTKPPTFDVIVVHSFSRFFRDQFQLEFYVRRLAKNGVRLVQAETVRLIFRLAREGDGVSGPMGVKSITKHLNVAGIRTRDGGRWGIGAVHKVLTRTTYVGRHRFNTRFWKTRQRKSEMEVVEMAVPPIIDAAEFEAVQTLLYDAIENGVADLSDPMLKNRIAELKAIRDQARADAERAEDAVERLGPSITPQALKTFARQARKRMRTEGGGYRRDHLRALAQRVEVDTKEVRILGSKSVLLRTLVAASSAKTAGFGVTSFVPKWRARRDSNS